MLYPFEVIVGSSFLSVCSLIPGRLFGPMKRAGIDDYNFCVAVWRERAETRCTYLQSFHHIFTPGHWFSPKCFMEDIIMTVILVSSNSLMRVWAPSFSVEISMW